MTRFTIGWWRWLWALVLIGFAGVAVLVVQRSGLLDPMALRELVAGYGAYAPFVYIGLYAVATMLAIPGAVLTLAGGILFGPLIGTVATVIGATIGATGSFLLVRLFRRGGVTSTRPATSRWQQVVANYDERLSRSGLLTMLILRLMPVVPFNALNYALGFTSVRTRDYVLATVFGITPGTFAYVYFGDALAMLTPLHLAGAVVLLGGVVLLGKYLQRHYG